MSTILIIVVLILLLGGGGYGGGAAGWWGAPGPYYGAGLGTVLLVLLVLWLLGVVR